MQDILIHIAKDFTTLFVVVDPICVLPVFLALTGDCPPAIRRTLAVRGVAFAFVVMLFFIAAAQIIVEAVGLSLRAFQIAGGGILFIFAASLVLGGGPEAPADKTGKTDYRAMAVYPLAIPSISGPGTMLTAMLITDNDRFSVFEQVQTALAGALVLAITLVILLFADPIYRVLGLGGTNVLKRIMGMMLAAVAANMMLSGLGAWLGLPKL